MSDREHSQTAREIAGDPARLRGIEAPADHGIWVGAAVRWSELEPYLAERDLFFPVHPCDPDATIGGWITAGGYGLNGMKYGHLNGHVGTLRVALSDGSLAEIDGNDPEFRYWFGRKEKFGSIAQVRLEIMPRPDADIPVLLYYESRRRALRHLMRLRDSKLPPAHAHFTDRARVRAMNEMRRRLEDSTGGELPELSDTLLLHFDDQFAHEEFVKEFGGVEGRFEAGDARRAPDGIANAVWKDRFRRLDAGSRDPELRCVEHLLDSRDYESFAHSARKLAAHLHRRLLLEAALQRSGNTMRILSRVTWVEGRKRGLAAVIDRLLRHLITRLGRRKGGIVIGRATS